MIQILIYEIKELCNFLLQKYQKCLKNNERKRICF